MFNPKGAPQVVVTASADHEARLWDLATQTEKAHKLHNDEVNKAVISPDGRWVATAGDDGTGYILDAKTFQAVGQPLQHGSGNSINYIAFSPDSRDDCDGVEGQYGAALGRFPRASRSGNRCTHSGLGGGGDVQRRRQICGNGLIRPDGASVGRAYRAAAERADAAQRGCVHGAIQPDGFVAGGDCIVRPHGTHLEMESGCGAAGNQQHHGFAGNGLPERGRRETGDGDRQRRTNLECAHRAGGGTDDGDGAGDAGNVQRRRNADVHGFGQAGPDA